MEKEELAKEKNGNCTCIEEVEKKIQLIKQKFINEIVHIGNTCDVPIEIIIDNRSCNNFVRTGDTHPFDIKIIIPPIETPISRRFILGNKSILLSQQLEK